METDHCISLDNKDNVEPSSFDKRLMPTIETDPEIMSKRALSVPYKISGWQTYSRARQAKGPLANKQFSTPQWSAQADFKEWLSLP